MQRSTIAVAVMLVAGGCGGKSEERSAAAAVVAAAASGTLEAGIKDAEQFQKERVAKGDTLALPYAELQKYLPTSISGYSAKEEPGGSSQSMAGFSMSQAEQTWVAEAKDGEVPEIRVTLVDFGGTQQGYAMMAAPLMMGFSQEDARRRVGSTKVDVPHTGGWEEFNKENKDAKITAITRYRYVITVEARNQGSDQSSMVKGLAEDIAKKFDGK